MILQHCEAFFHNLANVSGEKLIGFYAYFTTDVSLDSEVPLNFVSHSDLDSRYSLRLGTQI